MEYRNKYIWEGVIGAKIKEKNDRETGERFYALDFIRCFRTNGSEETKYSANFAAAHTEELVTVLKRTIKYLLDRHQSGSTRPSGPMLGRIAVARVPAAQATH